ncbi:MAG: HAMP domain-containing sensor histidine kinase [Cyanobacteriota bacterium]|jgi:signal transduction histidine kinase|nr:HAMP domain-containing sensor histidine kinase [Cyanobacteriota bacterium]
MKIKQKLTLGFFGISLLTAIVGIVSVIEQCRQAETLAMIEAQEVAETISAFATQTIGEKTLTPEVSSKLQEYTMSLYKLRKRDIEIIGKDGKIQADVIPENIGKVFEDGENGEITKTIADGRIRTFATKSPNNHHGVRRISVPVKNTKGERVAALVLEYTTLHDKVMENSKPTFYIVILTTIGCVSLALLSGYFIATNISKPLRNITDIAQQTTQQANFDLQVAVTTNDELGILGTSFNKMIERVKELLVEKEERATELVTINENLKNTQNQLVAQEKMAALGSLTAGIAHEINTPLGIGISAASLLDEKTRLLSEAYHDGTMKRSDLDNYLNTATQSNNMLMGNLQRAAELVQSFKQIAIDQSSEEIRTFNIKEYLQGVLIQLNPKLKQTKHKVEISGEEDINITSYPGAFSQIITNLVMNSLIHAYEPEDSGLMLINFYQEQHSSSLFLEYTDDGKGIATENLQKIFDPFFTTKRNQGGSGLGLHIIFNIVNQKLSGTIECESKLGLGTKFMIKIPTA